MIIRVLLLSLFAGANAAIYGLSTIDNFSLHITCTRPMDGCAIRGRGNVDMQGSQNNFVDANGALVWIRTPAKQFITLLNATDGDTITATCADESCSCETFSGGDCPTWNQAASVSSPTLIQEASQQCDTPSDISQEDLCPHLMREYGLITKEKHCKCRYNFCGGEFAGCSSDSSQLFSCDDNSVLASCTIADRFEAASATVSDDGEEDGSLNSSSADKKWTVPISALFGGVAALFFSSVN